MRRVSYGRKEIPFARNRGSLLSLSEPGKRLLTLLTVWVVPFAVAVLVIVMRARHGLFAVDFRGNLWQPARDVVHGLSPYPPSTREGIAVGAPFVYPPLALAIGLPFAFLPWWAAAAAWTTAVASSIVAALRFLGVSDWRCIGLALLALPAIEGLGVGNLTLLFPLGLALSWRYRDRPWLAGSVVGLMVGVKLFLWPLLVWLVFTRRTKAAAASVLIGATAVLASWAAIGFDGLAQYPSLLRVASSYFGPETASISAFGTGIGLPADTSRLLQNAIGLAVLAFAASRVRKEDGDRQALSLAIIAALVLAPIVWTHSFLLLIVPIALYSPRFQLVWLIPTAFWLKLYLPAGTSHLASGAAPVQSPPLQIALCLLLAAATALATTGVLPRGLKPARKGLMSPGTAR